jgi:hypothetical protein
MDLIKLQEKIKADILDINGNLKVDGITLHLAMIQHDIKIMHNRLEELEKKIEEEQ